MVCLGIIGITGFAVAPPAEANQYNRQLRRENRELRRAVRHDSVIGVVIGEMGTTMDDLEDTALFVLLTDMGIEMDSGITALLGFMFKSDFEGYSISSLWGSLHVC